MRARGFTLLELLVALAVMGLILVLAMPNFHAGLTSRQIDSTARLLRDAMTEARSHAIAQQRPATVTLDLEKRAFRVGDGGPWTLLEGELDLEFTTALSEQAGRQSGRVRFFPDGTSSGAVIRLAGAGREFVLGVDWLTGRARLREAGAGTP